MAGNAVGWCIKRVFDHDGIVELYGCCQGITGRCPEPCRGIGIPRTPQFKGTGKGVRYWLPCGKFPIEICPQEAVRSGFAG